MSMWMRFKGKVKEQMPALESVSFRIYFVGQTVSRVGSWFAKVAQQWLIYPVLTNRQELLGVVSAVQLVPSALLMVFGGVVADRVDKRKFVIWLQLVFAIISTVLAWLIFTGNIQVWHVMGAALVTGILFALDVPIRKAMLFELVEKKNFPSALALETGSYNVSRALGPAVAGFLIAVVGISAAYLLDAISFLVVSGMLVFMSVPYLVKPVVASKSMKSDLMGGFEFVWERKVLVVLLMFTFLNSVFTWPKATLMPVLVHDVYGAGEIGFGLLNAVFGLGATVAAVFFNGLYHRSENKHGLLMLAFGVTIVMLLGLAINRFFLIALVLEFFSGWGVATVNVLIATLIQTNSPGNLRGRISSIYYFVMTGAMPVGALLGSVGVKAIGVAGTIAVCGVLLAISLVVVLGVTWAKLPVKMRELAG